MLSTKISDKQSTPQNVYDGINAKHGPFGLDVAADAADRKCARWFGPGGEQRDALECEWPVDIKIWCNPPYSRGFQLAFVKKAIACAERGGYVVMLLPADTSTILYHDYVKSYKHIFLKGRLKFNGAKQPAKFGSMLVIFTKAL